MDGNKKMDRARSPQAFVAAWRKIHDIFVQEGARNAVWVWCPNASAFNDDEDRIALKWYPGPNYVDWICGDGYNFAPNRPGDRWRSFDEIFEGFYKTGKTLNKPMMVGEFGVLEDPQAPGRKEAWFHEAHDHLATKFPAIAALVYFNADSTTNGVYFDWRVDTSPSSFEGFHYLFTGPAPIPKPLAPAPPPPVTTAPAPVTTAPKPKPVVPATTRPTAPRPSTPKPSTAKPAVTTTTVPPPPKTPSPRLTWVLEVLHHLGKTDSAGST
jgi:hypothetical protein